MKSHNHVISGSIHNQQGMRIKTHCPVDFHEVQPVTTPDNLSQKRNSVCTVYHE